ncbi:MAG: hypothetical protein U0871_08280 [Gemmataceae bacterium]
MPPDPDKRKLRELKRAVKKRGTKHRRRAAKQALAENPEGAAEVADDFGRHTSATLNGLDRDSTRKRDS